MISHVRDEVPEDYFFLLNRPFARMQWEADAVFNALIASETCLLARSVHSFRCKHWKSRLSDTKSGVPTSLHAEDGQWDQPDTSTQAGRCWELLWSAFALRKGAGRGWSVNSMVRKR